MTKMKWMKSEDFYTNSRDGHYEIEPMFNHSERPAYYKLYFYGLPGNPLAGRQLIYGWCDTQAEAKDKAERHRTKRMNP